MILLALTACLPAPLPRDTFAVTGEIVSIPELTATVDQATVAMVEVDVRDYSFALGEILASTDTSGIRSDDAPFALDVPLEPPDDALIEAFPEEAPGVRVAIYLVGAWAEQDGVDGPTEGDTFVGVTPTLFAYVEGDPGQALTDAGARPGWNAVTLDLGAPALSDMAIQAFDGDALDLPLPANLFEHLPDELSGTLPAGTSDHTSVRVYLSSLASACGPEPTIPIVSYTTVERFASDWTLPGPFSEPAADHFQTDVLSSCDGAETLYDTEIAPYILAAYQTDDLSQPVAASTTANPPLVVVYMRPRGLRAGLFGATGGAMGWQIMKANNDWSDLFQPWGQPVELAPAR